MVNRHILVVTFPAQGHLNPALQFAKRLLRMGIHVTFATSLSAHRHISTTAAASNLTFASFSDGYDDGFKMDVDNPEHIMSEIKNNGSHTVKQIITESAEQGRPVNYVVYTLLLPWASRVARELHVPSAHLWIQPASVLDIYYYYFNGYKEIISTTESKDPSLSIELPGLPLLKARDIPSFLLPSDPYTFFLPTLKEQLEIFDQEENPIVLINTFDALESDALRAIAKLQMIAVGPLVPSILPDGQDSTNNSYGGDLFMKSSHYMEFLNSKQESSVIYISFGSILVLKKTDFEEIGRAILETRRPFLWVIRQENKVKEKLEYSEELLKQGLIVSWCSQVEVLCHPSLGCFVTHCGWNSTLESLTCGVPVVAFPHWTDQGTNAKLIEDVWRTGVRVRAKEGDGIVESREISRCIEMVMSGEYKGNELRRNAIKWKELAKEALMDGGSADKNLIKFVDGL